MTREVDLVSYLPPFMAEYKEINAVLTAEMPEFEAAWRAVDGVLYNEFISTADEDGIARFEKMTGVLPSQGDTLEIRRARVMNKWLSRLPYTVKMLIAQLRILCGGDDFTVKRKFEGYQIDITTHLREHSRVQELDKLLEEMIPANIKVVSINITAVKADGEAVVYSAIGLSGIHKKIKAEVKNYGLE
ncbi:MAG: YmfQ family protein [Ruminiclostridium sp.]|nr:YmfQ family protein [Ruminiclostridium sp.]